MLHGLCGKWQQPQAYYLIHGSTKGEILVGVLDACHSAGLVVVASVSDIGANSVKAKKQLDVSGKAPFIRFQYQNTATLFDPPHLFQCTHSHFPKYYIVNGGCGITVHGEQLTGTAAGHIETA
jgi:hypothetical protein